MNTFSVKAPTYQVILGLRIIQQQVNPWNIAQRYVVDLKSLQEEDPGFLEDVCAAWDWISAVCFEAQQHLNTPLETPTAKRAKRRPRKALQSL